MNEKKNEQKKSKPHMEKIRPPHQLEWTDCLGLLLCTITLSEYFRYVVVKDARIFSEMVAVLVIGVVCIATASILTRKHREIPMLMNKYIKDNRLYQSQNIKKGKNKAVEQITYFPSIQYWKEKKKNIFCIRIRLDGSPITEKMKNIEEPLADLFKTICVAKIPERGYLTYCLELQKQAQIKVESRSDIPKAGDNEIVFSKDISWNWKKCPHILITGETGTGKTQLTMYVISCLISQNVKVVYIDPKNDDDVRAWVEAFPFVRYVTESKKIAECVREIAKEVMERKRELNGIKLDLDCPPIFLFFDELIAFSKTSDDKKVYDEVMRMLSTIIVSGRSKNIHAGIVMQRPDTKYIEGAIRENLSCRICMGEMSNTGYEMVYGEEHSNVKNRRTETGSGLIFRSGIDSVPREFITPFICNGALTRDN